MAGEEGRSGRWSDLSRRERARAARTKVGDVFDRGSHVVVEERGRIGLKGGRRGRARSSLG